MLSNFNATMIVEGVDPVEMEEEYAEAVQHLIDTGIIWQLQGFFGRIASDFINSGLCHHKNEE